HFHQIGFVLSPIAAPYFHHRRRPQGTTGPTVISRFVSQNTCRPSFAQLCGFRASWKAIPKARLALFMRAAGFPANWLRIVTKQQSSSPVVPPTHFDYPAAVAPPSPLLRPFAPPS